MTDRPDETAPAPGDPGGRPAGAVEPDDFPSHEPGHSSDSVVGPLVVGVGLVVVGLVLLTQVFAIDAEGFSPEGPKFFPLLVLSLLTALSVV